MVRIKRYFLPGLAAIIFAFGVAFGKEQLTDAVQTTWIEKKQQLPLFQAFPSFMPQLAYVPLGLLPTPLEQQPLLAQRLQLETLWVKRDDLSGELFGGNKVRKLEFLLSKAYEKEADRVVTWGAPGSSHTTATAIYCHKLGLPCTCMYLAGQNQVVNELNVRLTREHHATEEIYRGFGQREQALRKKNKEHRDQTGRSLYFVPEGGSDVLGALGFVNAVCEVAQQLQEQQAPFPDVVYLLSGSSGSVAGFLVGLDLLNIQTKPVIVALAPDAYPSQQQTKIEKLYAEIMQLITHLDLKVRTRKAPQNEVLYKHGFSVGSVQQLGEVAPMVKQACRDAASYTLDPIYGTKLWSALMLDAQEGLLDGQCVLLWNTGSLITS